MRSGMAYHLHRSHSLVNCTTLGREGDEDTCIYVYGVWYDYHIRNEVYTRGYCFTNDSTMRYRSHYLSVVVTTTNIMYIIQCKSMSIVLSKYNFVVDGYGSFISNTEWNRKWYIEMLPSSYSSVYTTDKTSLVTAYSVWDKTIAVTLVKPELGKSHHSG